MSNSGYTCVRYIFCFLNVLLWFSACALIGVGVWLHVSYAGYTSLVPQYSYSGGDTLCVIIGVVTLIVAFFGCCGAWLQSRCMLITYFCLVILLFLVEFLTGTMAFIYREDVGYTLRNELKMGLQHHYNVSDTANPNSLMQIWDHVQTEFHCCGVMNYEDWYKIDAWPQRNKVPRTCCMPPYAKPDCGREGNQDWWWVRGCADQIQMWLVNRLHIIGIVGLIVAFVQLFGLISSMLLFCTVRHKRTSRTYKAYDRT